MKTKPLKELTLEEHERLAERLCCAEVELYQVLVAVRRAYGVSDRAVRPLEKMVERWGLLSSIVQCRMDGHFYLDGHQGHSPYAVLWPPSNNGFHKLLKELTLEEHERLAERLRCADSELWEVLVAVQRAYGVSDRAIKLLAKMVITGGLLDIVQCRMDDHFYHDGHQGDSPYYGRHLTPPPPDACGDGSAGAAAGEPEH